MKTQSINHFGQDTEMCGPAGYSIISLHKQKQNYNHIQHTARSHDKAPLHCEAILRSLFVCALSKLPFQFPMQLVFPTHELHFLRSNQPQTEKTW